MNFRPARALRPITPEYLEKAALHYLQRYASSTENLRQVLLRRLRRRKLEREQEYLEMIDGVVGKIVKSNLLDDRNFAWHRIKSLSQAGKSWRKIQASLQQKGVASEDIDAAREKLLADEPDMEWQAALKFARRKKIGPFRKNSSATPELRQREMQQMAAGGFSYATARQVMEYKEEE